MFRDYLSNEESWSISLEKEVSLTYGVLEDFHALNKIAIMQYLKIQE